MTRPIRMSFCGAFNGIASMRKGETEQEFGERIERVLQAALDRECKRLNVVIGVDFGDINVVGEL